MESKYMVGDYVASEGSVLCVPRFWTPDWTHQGALYVHGAGEVGVNVLGALATQPLEGQMFRRLVDEFQIPIYSADLGGPGTSGTTGTNSWGNTNAQTRVGQARTALQRWGARGGKVILIGISMGSVTALNFAKANPTLVAAVICILPAVDVDDIRNNDRGSIGLRAAIDSAWAVTYPAALPAGANPTTAITAPFGVPVQLWYADDDAIAIPSAATAFGATVGADMHNMGSGGHTDASAGHVDVPTMFAWLQAVGALNIYPVALTLPGTSGKYASAPDTAALSITGDIDIRVKCSLANWVPAAISSLLSKYDTGGKRSYDLRIDTAGKIALTLSSDGAASVTITSSAATGLSANAVKWIRATLKANDGSGNKVVKFYTSDDGATWTQLGTTQTVVGTIAIFDSTALLTIGGITNGTAQIANSNFYRAQIRNNILDDGTGIIFDADFTSQPPGATSFTEWSTNAATVTLNGGTTIAA